MDANYLYANVTNTADQDMMYIIVPLVVTILLFAFMCFCCCDKEKRLKRREDDAFDKMKEFEEDAYESPQFLTKAERKKLRKERKDKLKQQQPKERLETPTEEHLQDGDVHVPIEEEMMFQDEDAVEYEDIAGPPDAAEMMDDPAGPVPEEMMGEDVGVEEEIEYRMDPEDGQHYDYQSFIEAYGEEAGHTRWEDHAHTAEMVPVSRLNDLY